jgi:hypothetical protein
MVPVICRCCGLSIHLSGAGNPNVCAQCDAEELEYPIPNTSAPLAFGSEASSELEQLLMPEGPSVIECLDASEQASQAIREAQAEENKKKPAAVTQPVAASSTNR